MDRNQLNEQLPDVVRSLVTNIESESSLQHLNRVYLPSRDAIIESIGLLRQIIFPGYYGKQGLTSSNLPFRVGELMVELTELLYEQVRFCLRYREQIPGANGDLIRAYLARPTGDGPFPAVLLIHHAPGWDEWYRETTLRQECVDAGAI